MKAKVKTLVALITAAVVAVAVTVFEAGAADATRTIMKVENLSCGSCLSKINDELQDYDGMLGMDADLRQGLVVVDHKEPLTAATLAFIISDLGYPAMVLSNAAVQVDGSPQNGRGRLAASSSGCGGCGSGGCSIKEATWKKVFQRYFGEK